MTESMRRKRYQVHLSTAIVMMFVAGGIIWANIQFPSPLEIRSKSNFILEYGFPLRVITKVTWYGNQQPPQFKDLSLIAILIDSAYWSPFFFVVWFVCEYLIRHRAARKEA